MAIREVLQGCGAFDLTWGRDVPLSVRRAMGDGATLLVFDARPDVVSMTDANRSQALFEGIITELSTSGLSGWEASWCAQKPNGDSAPMGVTSGVSVTNVKEHLGYLGQALPGGVLFDRLTGFINGTGLSGGDLYNTALASGGFTDASVNVATLSAQWGVRTFLDGHCEQVSINESAIFSWRVNPGMTVDVGLATSLYRQGEVVLTGMATGATGAGGVRNLRTVFDSRRSIEDYVYSAQRRDSAGTSLTGFNELNATSVTSPDGSTYNFWRLLPSVPNDTDAEAFVGRTVDGATLKSESSATVYAGNVRALVGPGDLVYRSDPDVDYDSTDTLAHLGGMIPVTSTWVSGMTWSPTEGMGVVARRADGTQFVDLTPYVVLASVSTGTALSVSDVWEPAWVAAGAGDVDRLGGVSR